MVATECLAAYLLSNREHVSSVEVHPCEQSSTSLPVILCGQPQLPGAIQDRGEYNIEPEGTTSGSSHSILAVVCGCCYHYGRCNFRQPCGLVRPLLSRRCSAQCSRLTYSDRLSEFTISTEVANACRSLQPPGTIAGRCGGSHTAATNIL